MSLENDPLYRLRHALTGLALALMVSVPVAALLGRWVGDAVAGTYGARVTVYGLLLLHVVVGAVVLFLRVARHETRPVSVQRVLLWVLSLWLWPALFMSRKPSPGAGSNE